MPFSTPRLDLLDRNLLINGRHELSQRGASKTLNSANGYYLADRFLARSVNAVGSVETNLLATVLAGGPDGMQYIRLSPQAVTTRIGYGQRIENITLSEVPVGTILTLSAYVKRTTAANSANTNVTLAYHAPSTVHGFNPISDGGTDEIYSTSYNGLSDTVFTRINGTITVTQQMKDNGLQCYVRCYVIGEGAAQLTGNTLEVTGFALTMGRQVIGQVPRYGRDFGEELTGARRYYEKSYALDVAPGSVTFINAESSLRPVSASRTALRYMIRWAVTKRAIPAFNVYNPANGLAGNYYEGGNNIVMNIAEIGINSVAFSGGGTGGNTPAGTDHDRYHWVADAEL